MAKEPKDLNEIKLGDDENIPEKFRGKTVDDLLKAYKESEDAFHLKSEEVKKKDEEIDKLKNEPEPTEPEPTEPEPTEPEPDDLYGDDEYLTKKTHDKKIADMEKSFDERLQKAKEEATAMALGQIERNKFIDDHPEMFEGKKEEDINKIIKRIAGAGVDAGKRTLEGGLQAIQELGIELGLTKPSPNEPDKKIPTDLPVVGEYETVEDEIAHMKKFQKENSGKISDTLI